MNRVQSSLCEPCTTAASRSHTAAMAIGRKGKAIAARVDTFVAFPADMSEARKAGTWGCILRAGGVIVQNLFIRLE